MASSGDNGAAGVLAGRLAERPGRRRHDADPRRQQHWSSETGWSGSGGGLSTYETQPAYQKRRGDADDACGPTRTSPTTPTRAPGSRSTTRTATTAPATAGSGRRHQRRGAPVGGLLAIADQAGASGLPRSTARTPGRCWPPCTRSAGISTTSPAAPAPAARTTRPRRATTSSPAWAARRPMPSSSAGRHRDDLAPDHGRHGDVREGRRGDAGELEGGLRRVGLRPGGRPQRQRPHAAHVRGAERPGASTYTWAGSTSDPRAAEGGGGEHRPHRGRVVLRLQPLARCEAGRRPAAPAGAVRRRLGQLGRRSATTASTWSTTPPEPSSTAGSAASGRRVPGVGRHRQRDGPGHQPQRQQQRGAQRPLPGGAPTATTGATASFLKADTTTQGTWKGAYGATGFDLEGDPAPRPHAAHVRALNVTGASTYTWAGSTSDPRAAEGGGGEHRPHRGHVVLRLQPLLDVKVADATAPAGAVRGGLGRLGG